MFSRGVKSCQTFSKRATIKTLLMVLFAVLLFMCFSFNGAFRRVTFSQCRRKTFSRKGVVKNCPLSVVDMNYSDKLINM